MGKNNLADLNDILFAQLDRLNRPELKGEDLREEIDRADSMAKLATQVVNNANVILKAAKFQDDKWSAEQDKATTLLLGE